MQMKQEQGLQAWMLAMNSGCVLECRDTPTKCACVINYEQWVCLRMQRHTHKVCMCHKL